MQFFPDPQTFIAIGSLSIKWYAVIILCGAILAYSFCVKEIKKMGYKAETAEDLFLGCLICGLIGAAAVVLRVLYPGIFPGQSNPYSLYV